MNFTTRGRAKKFFPVFKKKRTKENQRGKLFSAGESDLVSEAVQQNQKNIHWLTSMEIVKETKDNYLSMFLNLCDNHLVYTMR